MVIPSFSLILPPSHLLVHSLLSFFHSRCSLASLYTLLSSAASRHQHCSSSRSVHPPVSPCLRHCLPLLFHRLPTVSYNRVLMHARTHSRRHALAHAHVYIYIRTRAQLVAGTCTIPSIPSAAGRARDRVCFFPPPHAAPRFLPRLGAGDHRRAAIPLPSLE